MIRWDNWKIYVGISGYTIGRRNVHSMFMNKETKRKTIDDIGDDMVNLRVGRGE